MKWLAETHGVKFELVRHFLARMLEGEWAGVPGQWRQVAIGLTSLFLPAGALLMGGGKRGSGVSSELGLLTLLCSITGMIALMEWQALFPSARDYLALASLPVRSRQVFAARFSTVLLFSAGLVAALNLTPSLLAPTEFGGGWHTGASWLRQVEAQAAASGVACFFTFFAIVALEGVLLNLLPGAWFARVSAWVQGMLAGVFLLGGLYSWSIQDWEPALVKKLPEFGQWLPPVWFTGLHQSLVGAHDPFFAAMRARGLGAAGIALALTVLAYLASFGRYRKLLVETPVRMASARTWPWSLSRLLARSPRRVAVVDFMAKTLARSRAHRAIWLAYVGGAAAIVLNSSVVDGALFLGAHAVRKALQFAVLFWPLACSVVLISGFRHVVSIPAELRSNWIFRMNESQGRREWMSAVERFTVAYAIAPVYLLLFPVAVRVLGWPMTLRMTALQVLVSLSIFEMLFHSWQSLPFTCSYLPGKRPLVEIVAAYLVALCAGVPLASVLIASAANAGGRLPGLYLGYLAFFAAVWWIARRRRREGWGEAPLLYEDLPQVVFDLGIREMSWARTHGQPQPEAAAQAQQADPQEPAAGGGGSAGSGGTPPHADRSPTAAPPITAAKARERLILPQFLGAAIERLRALFRRRQLDRDLEDELQFHLAMRAGQTGDPAQARRQFGNLTALKETCRDIWTFTWIETFLQDLRYALRQLRLHPGFTAVAALTLALGIGATTAIFSVLDTVVEQPRSWVRTAGLAIVLEPAPGGHFGNPLTPADMEDIRRGAPSLESLAAWKLEATNIVDAGGEPMRAEAARVTRNFFDVMGVQPALGRAFQPGEDQPGRDREVVLSDDLWRRRFGADPRILGRTIRVNGRDCTVVGVMPPKFRFPAAWRDLWTPLALPPGLRDSRSQKVLEAAGRLEPGRTVEQLAAELRAIGERLAKQYPETNRGRRFAPWTLGRYMGGDYLPVYLSMIRAASLFVLLIACGNVANLQLARAMGRWREVAVRTALGAGRRRIVRQLLTESLVLAMAAGGLGLLFARWALALIKAGVPAEMRHYMPTWQDIGLNPHALLLALGAAVASGMLAGLLPAWRSSRPNLVEALKEAGRGTGGGGRHRLRMALVAGQMALAVMLLVGAGLMVRSFRALATGQPNLDPASLLTMRISLDDSRYHGDAAVSGFYRDILARIAALPGVRAAAVVTALPYSRTASWSPFSIDGRAPERGTAPTAMVQSASPDYFRALAIPLRAGRLLGEADTAGAPPAAVIGERMARRWWPTGPLPIGQRIRLGAAPAAWVAIVGVVGDIHQSALEHSMPEIVYLPEAQSPRPAMNVAVRTSGDALRMAPAVAAAVRAVDPEQPIENLATLDGLLHQEIFVFSYMAWLMGIFGAVALTLAVVGVYGVMSYLVSQQTHEIGVRIALGAPRGRVIGAILGRGMLAVGIGLAIGLLPAYGLARLVAFALWRVNPAGLATFAGIPLLLALAAALAIYIPARRAVATDPMAALRVE